MKLSKGKEKYLLEKYFKTKNNKNIPTHLSQFGHRSSDTTDEDLFFITQYVSEIDRLSIGESYVTIYGLEYLKRIKRVEYLDLRGMPLNDNNLDCILHFVDLEYLDIKSSNVTSIGISKILETFSKLETIRIDIPIRDKYYLESWEKKYPNCDLIINLKPNDYF